MQEFWFCASCKSMNRANAPQCYRCKSRKTEATLATVANRQQDVVLTPGLDEEHREVAWTLMFRQKYISAWGLGYLAAGLILATLAVATFATVQAVVIIIIGGSFDSGGMNVTQLALLRATVLVTVMLAILMVVVHSVFLCLTSMNAPGLGSGSPRFDPARAAVWWIESALWAIRGGLAFVIPPMLAVFGMLIGGLIFGLAIGMVWAVCAFWLLGDPITNLGKPKRLLQDLWDRLGVPGSPDSRIVTLWSVAWGTGRGVEYAVSAMLFLAIIVLAFVGLLISLMGLEITPASQGQTELVARLTTDLIVIVQFVADGIGLCLLAQITIELAKRQRVREAWVLRGLDDARAKAYAGSQMRDADAREAAARNAAASPQSSSQPNYAPQGYAPQQPAWIATQIPGGSPAAPAWAPIDQQSDPADPTGNQTFSGDAAEPAELAAEPPSAPDRTVIQPSSSAVGRYRAPVHGAEDARPVEAPSEVPNDVPVDASPTDLDSGAGI